MKKRSAWYLMAAMLMLLFAFGHAITVQAQGTIISLYENLALGGGRLSIQVNLGLVRWNELHVEVNPGDVLSRFVLITPNWTFGGILSDEEGRRFLVLRRPSPGVGLENIEIRGPAGRGRLGRIVALLNGFQQVVVTSQPTFLPIEISMPPGGGPIASLKGFDANRNNRIDDLEFFAIIDAWIAGRLDNNRFFEAVDLWVSQRPISAGGLRSLPQALRAVSMREAVLFLAQAAGVASMEVEIFNVGGQRVFAQRSSGPRLIWSEGARPANGVYIYRVSMRDVLGRVSTQIGKFALQR